MIRFLLICLGGALGTGARYLVQGWALQAFGPAFPAGTFAVNLVGSFLIAVVMKIGLASELISPELRVVLVTGVLGGFTTYSSFSFETLRMLDDGAWGLGLLYVAGTVLGCLAAGAIGLQVGKLAIGS